MELRQLKYFKAACELRNFSEAARLLHISQSTLSQQVKQLEDELDVPLFDRVGKRVVPTEAGLAFLPYATKAIHDAENGKQIIRDLKVSMNASFMYTNVKLPDGGAYTNSQRALQGASPYLINADVTYSPRFSDTRMLNLALLYNLQGPRIHAVGISGLGDVKQQPVHTLDFVAGYQVNERFNLKLQMKDILNRDVVFVQDVPNANTKMEVERFKRGAGFEIGASYNF